MSARSRLRGLYPFVWVLASGWGSPAAGQVVELNLPPVDEEDEAAPLPKSTESPSQAQSGPQRPSEAALPGVGGVSRNGKNANSFLRGFLQNPQAVQQPDRFMKGRGAARAGRPASGQDADRKSPGGGQMADMLQRMLRGGGSRDTGQVDSGAPRRGQGGRQLLDLMRSNRERRSRTQGSDAPAEPRSGAAEPEAPAVDQRPQGEAGIRPGETRQDRAKDSTGGPQDPAGLAGPRTRTGADRLVAPSSPRFQRRYRRPRRRE